MRDLSFKERLEQATPDVDSADQLYRKAAMAGRFADLTSSDFTLPNVSAKEMTGIYERRMAAKRAPGRAIYDELRTASRGGKCPLCGHRDVMTLDHYLPKAYYPALTVNPVNLVPACSDCNKAKSNSVLATMHPYYDNIENEPWLQAKVLQLTPAAVCFWVNPPDAWPPALTERVIQHFDLFGLDVLYAAQAARNLSGIRRRLADLFNEGSAGAVRQHLAEEAQSWREFRLNSWEAALYDSLANSDWFCNGGFRFES